MSVHVMRHEAGVMTHGSMDSTLCDEMYALDPVLGLVQDNLVEKSNSARTPLEILHHQVGRGIVPIINRENYMLAHWDYLTPSH